MSIQDELLKKAKEMAGLNSENLLERAGSLLGGKSDSDEGTSNGGNLAGVLGGLDRDALVGKAEELLGVRRHTEPKESSKSSGAESGDDDQSEESDSDDSEDSEESEAKSGDDDQSEESDSDDSEDSEESEKK